MSADDYAVFKEYRKRRQKLHAERRAAWAPGPEWTRHHETHYSRSLLGDRLDYWPGPLRFRWRNETYTGDVLEFIADREAAEKGKKNV